MLPNSSYLTHRLPKAFPHWAGRTDRDLGTHLGVFRLVSWEGSLCVCPSAPSNIHQAVQTKYAPEGLGGDTAPGGTGRVGHREQRGGFGVGKWSTRAKRVQRAGLQPAPHSLSSGKGRESGTGSSSLQKVHFCLRINKMIFNLLPRRAVSANVCKAVRSSVERCCESAKHY